MLSSGRPGARLLLATGLVATTLVVSPLVVPAPARADEEIPEGLFPCSEVAQAEDPVRNVEPSPPLVQMQTAEINDRFATGDGIGVAVIDSGIASSEFVSADGQGDVVTPPGPIEVEHGTVVAGLIAGGPRGEGEGLGTGVAPDADLYSVRIVGAPEDDSLDLDGDFEPEDLITGLTWVARNAERLGLRIVNLSLNTDPSPQLADAVEAVQDAGVIVVAASGNRGEEELPDEGSMDPLDPPVETFPASLPDVVGVGAYVPPKQGSAAQFVLNTTNVDVAAPVYLGASVAPNGSTCFVDGIATSWATAYVSGVLALLAEYYPEDNDRQLVRRLVETASGTDDQRSTFTGFGVIQPLEAFTRELTPTRRDGELEYAEQADDGGGAAPAPPVRADELEGARSDFRWWGLLAGAVLVAAVILRPLMRRVGRR